MTFTSFKMLQPGGAGWSGRIADPKLVDKDTHRLQYLAPEHLGFCR